MLGLEPRTKRRLVTSVRPHYVVQRDTDLALAYLQREYGVDGLGSYSYI